MSRIKAMGTFVPTNKRGKAVYRASLLAGAGVAALVTATAYASPVSKTSPGFTVDTQVEMSLAIKPITSAKMVRINTVGSQVQNPETGNNETVVEVISTNVVRTADGNVIIIADTVDQTFVELQAAAGADPNANDATTLITWRITAVTTNGDGRVVSLDIERVDDTSITGTADRVTDVSGQVAGQGTTDGSNGTGASSSTLTPGANDINSFSRISTGNNGGNGSDGGGIRICFPFVGCATIGKNPSNGGGGGTAAAINETVTTANNGNISTVSDDLPGISLQSLGGSGGSGGTSYLGLNLPGANGGDGGDGGTITLTADVDITTTGERAHGISAQSIGGRGGAGGDGYGVDGSGGTGGRGSAGGTVTVTNHGDILTTGDNAIGIYAQSIGGAAGAAGDGGGFIASGGAAVAGGQGGTVSVTNSGSIETRGENSYGILAQSIGGEGGNAGDGTGAVAAGGDGGAGGTGGNVTVTTTASSSILTGGLNAHGIFAQSIGGGGGSGGDGSGIAGLGSTGSSGGDSGTVTVTNAGAITTTGVRARGIFAQSVGGGGGDGGSGAGLVSIGGAGGQASTGGVVTVTNTGDVRTTSGDSNAIQAQSIGGGGGDGGSAGGAFFTIGGEGGGGGDSSLVTVNHSGDITTSGDDSRGIFVQSIGGGGGNGGSATSVSLFAGVGIGGAGGDGGAGGQVDVNFSDRTVNGQTFSPLIQTSGDRAQGVFAQSVGGGGGNGGAAITATVGYGASASIAVGGDGGDGGEGGLVTVDGDVIIVTDGISSDGMFAQSVGGGGGNGGYAVAVAFAVGETAAASLSVGIGGEGGLGGNGGTVQMNSGGAITTLDDFSTGLIAQSVGGGGGNGGFSVSVSGAAAGVASASVAVGIGGSGGNGGLGGTVNADFDGSITTRGNNSNGAVIQSVGGGGGNGGYNISASVALAGAASGAASVGLGGDGGAGGDGGTVTGSVGGDVFTEGDRSTGVTIQSVGGGGGSGGFNISGSIGASGAASGAVSVGLGGAGDAGGSGGNVTGTAGGTITTEGDQSSGLVVQSVGGGGGNGGFNVSGSIGAGGTFGGGVSVGLGGAGGNGGNAGSVTGTANGFVMTEGDEASGIVVQSLGGGGGNGGMNISGSIGAGGTFGGGVSVGIGGSGGTGGSAGSVTASASGAMTEGDRSTAFIAQSVGGGGGNGGINVSGGIGAGGTAAGAISVGIGGSGGGGGNSSTVNATMVGNVMTLGDASSGIVAQSLGGGGGNGGFNISGGIAGAGTGAASINVGIGGSGGGGGSSGNVTLNVTGVTATEGDLSDAIVAQSLGGGGGNGGFNITGGIALSGTGAGTIGVGIGGTGGSGGNAGSASATVDATQSVTLPQYAAYTMGNNARAITVQSVGGGGGNGGFNVTGGLSLSGTAAGNIGVGLGGSGGNGGDSANAYGAVTGLVRTEGDDSTGLLVQSVGGGGGNGGMNISGGLTASKSASGNIMVGIGGAGGNGGDAGSATGFLTGDVTTLGDRASAVTYQSLGGGGGNGGFNITGALALTASGGAGNVGVGVGGFGGDGGNANLVAASISSNILTEGDDAHAILLQSLGGSGGNGGFNITGTVSASKGASGNLGVGVGGFGGGGGNASTVDGTLLGDVTTEGDNSFGAMLQSLGGGGGNGGFNITGALSLSVSNNASVSVGVGVGGFGGGGGDADDVTGIITGNYVTSGDNADGIIAQSVGGGGGNGGMNITGAVALSAGTAGTGAVGIGGFGGAGGDSGTVILSYAGNVFTDGTNSDGIVAQSLGGGGGNGGINISGGVTATTNGSAASLGFGLGGFGGSGGDADNVTASVLGNVWATGLESDITTPEQTITLTLPGIENVEYTIGATRERLNGSHGVVAQSLGGGGGNGALNITGQISITQPGSTTVSSRAAAIGIGGFGGDGGDAGTVDLTIGAPGADRVQVQAIGDDRTAVIAQSLGGGGGNGGINISGGVAMDGTLTVGVGGFGGDGGIGRDVIADVDADLFASGHRSRGLAAQSIGGGGGNGAINISGGITGNTQGSEPAIAFGLGGFGGAGNTSGNVNVDHVGQILVDGIDSIGLLAQSIAGGGGSGGLNVTGTLNLTGGASGGTSRGYAASIGVGGSGGTGADAGQVVVSSQGNIIVNGQFKANPAADEDPLEAVDFTGGSTGLLAQSIGGGGGTGGMNITGTFALQGNPISVGVGGSGGTGGNASTVTVTRGIDSSGTANPGLIRTFGDNSVGLLAQSIGGGGGNAGMNFNFAAAVGNDTNNPVAALITIGGSGAGAGSGDAVAVNHVGNIVTDGRYSTGLHAQSLGGGGGNAAYNVGIGLLKDASSLNLAIGGDVGAGGTGGTVTVAHDGTIVTGGDGAAGIKAQSIGGGGGNTGTDFNMSLLAANSLDIVIGRQGGTGGAGGNVSVTAAGVIDTTGSDSSGIFAQSIGGGGGASSATSVGGSTTVGEGPNAEAYALNVAVGLEGGIAAISGDVLVTNTADITTRGDDSRAIFAQSVGGGGGAGGTTTNIGLQATGSLLIGVGGTGGTGALSGRVDVDNDAMLWTEGDRADGILAQAIGGGGGMGGMAISTGIQIGGVPDSSTSRTITVNVGGNGGDGADGGIVDVTNVGLISTIGELSHGIRAQSVGGGGGIGGGVLALRAQGKGNNQALDINVGGSGNTGGSGGQVDVANSGMIFTTGREAAGIVATSIGGGGGDAGTVINAVGGVSGSTNNSQQLAINIGGAGGLGGTGGDVTVSNTANGSTGSGQIVTTGENAYGIFAQSLGGGGGNGSTVYSVTAMQSSENSFIAGFNLGGSGGSGNFAGTVTVTNEGLIDTSGKGAHGILAQSVGGGGGNGGMSIGVNAAIGAQASSPILSIGGTGGSGGDGGTVVVNNSGQIVTRGERAHGIVAQSIGGGGGNASLGFGLTAEPSSLLLSNAVSALVGATGGGTGGQGGDVIVNHSGDITVLGNGSQAIKAESINGGGGTIALNFTGLVGYNNFPIIGPGSDSSVTVPTVQMAAGSSNTSDMNAGRVTIKTTGSFGAAGDNGAAAVNQSIGGGGGTLDLVTVFSLDPEQTDFVPVNFEMGLGGTSGTNNNGAAIASTHSGSIVTTGTNTHGVLIQSIGDGGGRGIMDISGEAGTSVGTISLTFGSENGSASAGGDITRTQSGSVATTGDLAAGTILQSIGGGGGLIGIDISGFGSSSAGTASALSPASTSGTSVTAIFGANGGSGLDGGTITADFSGGMATTGDDAQALVVQSIGAGGGELRTAGDVSLDLTFGGSNGAEGDGGDLTITNSGTIYTEGERSHGVVLQSIGGGGGAVFGDFHLNSVSLSDANVGDGGDTSFAQTGDITATGDNAIGLIVQSLGGGGGWANGSYASGGDGAGGAITINVDGAIFAPGENSSAVYAQSRGENGAGNILADITGLVRGGSGTGVGVAFDGGLNNQLTSFGSVSSVSGLAITGTDGNDTVSNFGLVVGNVDLGSGDNRFNNQQDATFVAFDTIDLRDPAVTTDISVTPVEVSTSAVSATPAAAAAFTVSAAPVDPDPRPMGGALSSPQTGEMIGDANGAPVMAAGVSVQPVQAEPAAPTTAGEGLYIAALPGSAVAEPGTSLVVSESILPAPVSATPELASGTIAPGSAEPASPDLRPANDLAPVPVTAPEVVPMPAPTRTQGVAVESFVSPAAVPSITGSTATFTNAGNFVMGLSAPRFPIDLLNGDTFGNLDAIGEPETNLLFGARVINTVDLDGNFVQTETGHLVFDVAYGPYDSDIVNVTGDTTVDGTGEVILTWLENDDNKTLFATAGTATDNGLEIEDTIAIDFGIEANDIGIQLTVATDFGQDFLNENGQSMGRHMDSAIRWGGSSGIGRLGALLGNLQAGQEDVYSAIFTELDPSGHLAPVQAQYDNAQAFSDALFSCESPVRQVEGQCIWTRLEASASEREETFETFSVESNALHFRGGFERQLDNPIWTMAAAIGYDRLDSLHIDDLRMRSNGQALHAGLGFERTSPMSGTIVGGGMTTGWQWTDAVRNQNIFGPQVGESSATSGYVTTELHIAQILRSGRVFARPELRGSVTALHHTGLEESGLDGLGVEILNHTEVLAALSPEVALGAVLHEGEDSAATFTVTFGADLQSKDRLELPMRLLGANPMADPAVIGTALDQESYRISTDLHVVGSDRLGLRFGYTAEFGDRVEDHRAGFDLRAKF